ncbi:1,6-anhydro-N-acetylmuramyl-L-alanine amidase AmpD [Aliidiomarina haloalkalitolerans]|uniref:1,6-anhydro-N-acetylmuramyl-L-alanine amidase AmpD n=1 Tax=Aliidiomarina haloalkalitolerans TaxID=859059 RepID=A0A432VT89_9GAMM|nr:1,6-anhydro-N-acetylmuramyl-L-alanine amidase AmpD [Aliidiomarina haloalkalitolerans]MCL4408827.1 1,6-anhydro-N-acetylmuramyl-L-alanine amidase AmpD [Gammaproteobacteria bacterium]RUO19503.1 1,6-anhydro-N-acetylmuramyl-L-alanine amidase AmpD [Aliidiomarina haloalkalitolerans]
MPKSTLTAKSAAAFAIKQHRLQGVRYCPSPHVDARPDPNDISLLVVHGISLPAGQFGGEFITDLFLGELDCTAHSEFAPLEGLRVSAHCLIRRDGEIIQYVDFDQRAWHAGVSSWQGRERCNDFAIGIELEGTDNTPYTESQYQVLAQVAGALTKHYPRLSADRIVGHEDIAPGRKTDPGPAFNWDYFRSLLQQETQQEAQQED